MQVFVNGAHTRCADGLTVSALVASRAGELRQVAVAVNSTVVPRSEWNVQTLHDGDVVELVSATAGG